MANPIHARSSPVQVLSHWYLSVVKSTIPLIFHNFAFLLPFFFFGCFSFPIVYLGRQTIPVFRTQIPAPYQRSLKHFIWHIRGLSQTSQEIFFIVDFCCLLSLLISGLPSSDTNLSISQSISAICKKNKLLKTCLQWPEDIPFVMRCAMSFSAVGHWFYTTELKSPGFLLFCLCILIERHSEIS